MVLICKYCGKKGGVEGRTLHKFPLKDVDAMKLWLQKINLGVTFVPTNSSRLCSEHFKKECFDQKDTRMTLRPGSIPELFGKYKITCAYCHAVKGEDKRLSFRKFPLENPGLLKEWMESMKLQNYVPDKKSVLCSDDFDKNCFYTVANTSYLRLRNNAVPSIFKKFEDVQLNSKKRLSIEPSPATKHQRLSSVVASPVHATENETSLHDSGNVLLQVEDKMETRDLSEYLCNKNCRVDIVSEIQAPVMEQDTGTTSIPGISTSSRSMDTAETLNTPKRRKYAQHDHSYETTPNTLKRKLFGMENKVKRLQKEVKVQRQHIGRLRRKIRTLKDIVSELRKTRAIPESGLVCLDGIADSDVSQLLQRFIKNQNNVGYQQRSVKKRAWKCQRRNPGLGISREKYPPALRSFAMPLHFYSPKAYGFVRRKFCQALPDPSTLRSWYSSIDGEPGFTSK